MADVTPPQAMQRGRPARQDYEYERRGTANLFMIVEPLAGWRHVKVTTRRLNTHKLSVLYQVFPPQEARRLYERFEIHHTPKHASWMNIAECELSVLGRQCLGQRIEDQMLLDEEVTAWEEERNGQEVRVDWQFTTSDARIKLKRLYPVLAPVTSAEPDY